MQTLPPFQFYGPNWHTDFAACEWLVWLDAEERSALRADGENMPGQLIATLAEWGIHSDNLDLFSRPLPRRPRARFAFLFNSMALALQRHAGHKVTRAKRILGKESSWVRAVFEVEDIAAGQLAGQLALHLMSRAMPWLKFTSERFTEADLPGELIERYREKSAKTALTADTQALIQAAERAGIPWLRLDQPPFRFRHSQSKTRENGNLLLGQGVNRHIIKGTLCLDQRGNKARPFLEDRVSITRMLAKLGARLPHEGREPPRAESLLQALHLAEQQGYPVVLKPVRRAGHEGVTLNVRNLEELMGAVNQAQEVSREFLVQRQIRGPTYRIVVSNGRFAGLMQSRPAQPIKVKPATSITELAERIARQLQVGLLVLTVVTPDISKPLEVTGGAVVDLDLAPRLGSILKPRSKFWKPIMDGFIDSLYPPGAESRIPLIAVTGTTGRTPTARLVDAIMRRAGFNGGLSCSEGVFVAGKKVKSKQGSKRRRGMHHRLVRKRSIDLAVMEFRFSQLKNGGFPFDWCNVGVVTEVTADLLQPGWETIGQLAAALRAVPERARDGAVLNADDPETPGMLHALNVHRVFLTSSQRPLAEFRSGKYESNGYVTIERGPRGKRIVISENETQFDLMDPSTIPESPGGATGSSVDNVLQAVAVGHLLQVPPDVIRTALASLD